LNRLRLIVDSKREIVSNATASMKERFEELGDLYIIYQVPDGGSSPSSTLLVDTAIAWIRNFENEIMAFPGYQDLCQLHTKKSRLGADGEVDLPQSEWRDECAPPFSVLNYFYPTLNESDSRHYRFRDVIDFVRVASNMCDPASHRPNSYHGTRTEKDIPYIL
jgi:hypothetical protein